MGFDNECILNIQSLPGEYFCPICRTLIYPNEALQAQCTHLYCKPCLAYIVATTQACPYDGYLVTEIDSKPLVESNKSLAETIGKVTVYCLYHKSGCQWQGTLSDCVTHCASCAFGNSPVVCNRCGTQIIHRQVQEHAQICPGLQSQVQQTEGAQPQSSGVTTTQAASQDPLAVASAAPAAVVTAAPAATATATTVSTTTGIAGATTAGTTAPVPGPAAAPAPAGQGQAVPQAPTAEQWYQQQLQYQQYYQQQYPGYNPYMQQYQQYGQYQQSYQQYTQHQMQVAPQHAAQASMQPSPYVQSQPQVQQQQPQPQSMVQPQPQTQSHLQPHLQAQAAPPPPQQHLPLQPVSQVPQMQAPQTQVLPQPPHPQAQPTAHPPAHTQVGSQSFGLPVTQAPHPQVVPHAQPQQQHLQPPQHQQAVAHQQHPQLQPPYLQPLPQQQQHGQPQMQPSSQIQHQHPQMQHQAYPQPQAYPHPQSVAQAQLHNPSAHAVTGHQSYPQPQPAQMPQGAPLQHPVHMSHQQGVSPQPAQMRPPQGQFSVQGQQPAMLPLQGTHPNVQHTPQQPHHVQQLPVHASISSQAPQHGFPPQQSVPLQTGQSYQQGMSSSQQQMHPQQPFQPHGPPYTQQHLHVHGFAGQQAQTAAVRPTGHGVPPQQLQHPPSGPVKDLQRSAMNQQPPMLMPSVNMGVASQSQGAGQPTGQGLLAHPESHASQSGKSEKTTYATGSTEISELHKIQGAGVQPVISESLGDQKMPRDSEESEFGNARKDAAQPSHTDAVGVQSDNTGALNKAKLKDEIADAHCKEDGSHDLDVSGDKGPKASDVSGSLERGSGQHLPQQNVGGLGPHVLQGTGQQQPPGPDRMHPLHMPHAGAMPYHMQGQRPEMLPNQMRPPSHILPENTRPPAQQLYSSYHSEFAPRLPGQFYGQNQNQMAMPQPAGIRPHGEGMIRPPMGGPSPGLHDVSRPPFALEHVGRPRPPGSSTLELEANTSGLLDARQVEPPFIQSGMPKSNGVGGPLIGGRALHEEGFKSAGEHIRPFASYHGRHNVNHRDVEEDLKQFSRPLHVDGEGFQRGPRPFGRAFGGSDGFPDSFLGRPSFSHQPRGPFPAGKEQYPPEFGERHRPSGFHEDFAIKANSAAGRPDFLSSGTEFGHHRIDGMPPFGSPGPFPGGLRKEQLGSGNLPGNMRHSFDGPEFPHARFHSGDSFGPRNLPGGGWRGEPVGPGQIRGIEPSGYRYPGQMHPDDPDFVIDYSRHGFPKESGHFGLGGYPRKREIGWCRICRFNCGGTEDLDLHVQTRDHQQRAMDLVLKMKQDVAKRQKLGSEGSKSFDEKKVSGKSSFGARGNRH